jgi:hypothetical protein
VRARPPDKSLNRAGAADRPAARDRSAGCLRRPRRHVRRHCTRHAGAASATAAAARGRLAQGGVCGRRYRKSQCGGCWSGSRRVPLRQGNEHVTAHARSCLRVRLTRHTTTAKRSVPSAPRRRRAHRSPRSALLRRGWRPQYWPGCVCQGVGVRCWCLGIRHWVRSGVGIGQCVKDCV